MATQRSGVAGPARDAAALARGLLTATTVVRAETIVRPLPAAKAAAVRDTISKALYNALFHWLVHRVNQVSPGTHPSWLPTAPR